MQNGFSHTDSFREDETRTFSAAPLVEGSTTEYYDSVQGFSNQHPIFVVYENTHAYPAYLISYED